MRKFLLMAAIGVSALLASPAKAQVSVNINIGSQPEWGPSGYNHVDYYYLPEIESYYYVPTRKFIYYSNNHWVHANYLPGRYRSYDLRRGRKVVINSDRPYLQHRNYRSQYNNASYRPERRVVYRESPRNHYYSERNNHRNYSNRNDSRGYERRDGNHGGREKHGHGGKH
ncbi:MAG: hypothetical protein JWQ28_1148 [Pedobacter sp.]|jgi:hypothetical protein|nr:hypothetical protein [Pedobacter sp.]